MFDFTIQRPSGIQRIDARDGVVIIEGLHALNPALTEELPEDAALCLYAGLREEYADSRDARCLATWTSAWHAVWCGTACSAATAQRLRWGCGATSARARTAISSPTSPAQSPAGHDPYLRVCLWRTVLDTMPADPALTATQHANWPP